jgi:hypothetical protein
MKLNNIAIERLDSQHILNHKFKQPSQLVSWLGAIQAQDYSGAKWAVGLRLHGITDKNVEQELKDRKFIRTWALRGTLHFVAASDINWLLKLIAPRIIARNKRRYRELKLDDTTLSKSNNILKNALQDGKHLNRRELLTILQQKGISTEGQRAAYILQRASLDGLICQTIAYRNNPIYLSMDELSKSKVPNRIDSLVELAKRYFNSHGPATLKDFVWWSGLLVKDARRGLEEIKSTLKKEIIGGQTYYWRCSSSSALIDSPIINLLPGFDEYLLSYKDRGASIGPKKIKGRLFSTNGVFNPTIISDGQVVGTWKREFKNDHVLIKIRYFRKFTTPEEEALKSEVDHYGEFISMPVVREY